MMRTLVQVKCAMVNIIQTMALRLCNKLLAHAIVDLVMRTLVCVECAIVDIINVMSTCQRHDILVDVVVDVMCVVVWRDLSCVNW